MDAEGDYISERAREMFDDGKFDEAILDGIDGGAFDEACIKRVIAILEELKK